jgi:CSLREA domain-containing protein
VLLLGLLGLFALHQGLFNSLQPTAHAATTFNVNSTGDAADNNVNDGVCNDGAGNCTLRAAIQQANASAGADTINFSVTGTINLASALPGLASDITLNGPGSGSLTVRRDSGGDYRIFNVNNGVIVSVSGLALTNGRTPFGSAGNFGGAGGDGGGIANFGTLTLTDVSLTANSTGAGGAGVSFGGAGGAGGAVYNAGTLTMTGCVVNGNSTGLGGDGNNGAGRGGDGGGVFNANVLTMTNCVVNGNSGGAAGSTNGIGGTGGRGGGIYSEGGTLTLNGVRVSNNTAGNEGGGSHGSSGFGGHGGGLFLRSGSVLLKDSTVSGNSAGTSPSGSPGYAGGIENGSALTIIGSTISGNTGNAAGAILNRLTLSLTNSTVSGNHLTAGSGGGAAINNSDSTSSITLTNCTITANDGPGVYNTSTAPVVGNTILAGNGVGGGPDVLGGFNSQGHNLVRNADGNSSFNAAGDQAGTSGAPVEPHLGPLADNGGPTLTHALLTGSPALDAGDDSLAKDANNNTLSTDQRGAGRFAASVGATATVDIGAFEFHPTLADVSDKTTNEDTPLSFIFFIGDDAASVTSVTASSDNQGLVPDANLSIDGTGVARTLTITPTANQSGTAHIALSVTQSGGATTNHSFLLTITPVNDAPSFTKGADPTVAEDSGAQTFTTWATAISAGPGESAQSVNFLVTGNTRPALFSNAPSVSPSGTLTFTPAPNANGSADITVVLKDDGGTANGGQDTSPAQTFKISVTPVNDPPTASSLNITATEDTPRSISFAGTDVEGDTLSFAVVSGPSHGTLSGTGASRTYTPAADYNGSDSFTYKAIDAGGAESAPATVSIDITAVNDAPANTVPGAQTTNQNTPLVLSAANSNAISVSDVDAGTDPLRVTLVGSNGSLTLGTTAGLTFTTGDGTDDVTMTFTGTNANINAALGSGLTFKPTSGYSGFASIQFTTNDQGFNGSGGARSVSNLITINIRAGGFLRFTVPTYSANENGGTAAVTVTRTGGGAGAASINYATSDGTAAGGSSCGGAGVDYVAASGTLTWSDNDIAAKTITVTICNDSLHESDETAGLNLSGATGSANLGTVPTATLSILDDDASGGIIELSQSGYTVAEGSGALIVTVRRAGDTTQAATVDYTTDDGSITSVSVPCSSTTGIALDRCDFTKAQGTLRFAAGETEKTFGVLVGDDSYVEGSETALIKLSNPGGGAVLGSRATATLEITDDAPESATSPIDDSAKFVRQHYHDFLNREPDAPGLQFWTGEIEGCGTNAQCREVKRINVSAAFFLSIEFQQTGYLVYRLDKVAYGNLQGKPVPLTLSEFLSDTQSIGQGVVVGATGWEQQLENNKRAFADAFVNRARFKGVYPNATTPEQYVDGLNTNAGGVLSQGERDSLVADLRNGLKTRAEVLRAVAENPTVVRRESNQAFVLMQFFGYLRRDPDSAPDVNFDGYNFWLGKLNQFNGNFIQAEMVKAFLSSDEYRKRFGQ